MCACDNFANVVANNFEAIKKSFITRLKQMGNEFDEDMFMDNFIKCCTTLNDKPMSKSDCINYFWRAYVNNLKTPSKFITISLDDPDRGPIVPDLPVSYNYSIDRKYQNLINLLEEKFGNYYTQAYILHFAEDKSYKELIELGFDFKHNNIFKRMTKYIKSYSESEIESIYI